MKARFEAVKNAESPNEALHVATLTQEAFLLFVIETLRFKSASVVKIHKLGNVIIQSLLLTSLIKSLFSSSLNSNLSVCLLLVLSGIWLHH
jgi:N-terminal acetyltransferase B complex non-catalytic subunit